MARNDRFGDGKKEHFLVAGDPPKKNVPKIVRRANPKTKKKHVK